jgi:hypothetical protein
MRTRITISVCSAAVLAAAVVSAQDTRSNQDTRQAASPAPITVTGCVAQASDTVTSAPGEAEHEADLVLTKASVAGRGASTPSAVPGSLPAGSGSGTVAAPRPQSPVQAEAALMTYTLEGTQEAQLKRLIGQRVEIVGTIATDVAAPARGGAAAATGSTERARGTSGEQASPAATGDAPAGGNVTSTGGRTQPPAPATAHPSAAAVRLTVESFKTLGGTCQ